MLAFLEPSPLQQEWVTAQRAPTQVVASDRTPQSSQPTGPDGLSGRPGQAIGPNVPVRSVSEFANVRPADWEFQALRALAERLGIEGLQGGRPITRYEFATLLQTALAELSGQKIEELTPAEIETIERLQADFSRELELLGGVRLADLTSRVETLEAQQFSPTTALSGEVILGLTGTLGEDPDSNLVLQQRVRFALTTSFTGEDRLRVSLRVGNFAESDFFDDVTREGRLGFRTNTDNIFGLSDLNYRFPIGDRLRLFISAAGDDIGPHNPNLSGRGSGAISRFGRRNPVYRLVENAGLGLRYEISDDVTLNLGYFVDDPEDSSAGNGLFNGNFSASARLEIEPSDRFSLVLLYVRSFNDSDLSTGTGSLRSQVDLDRPVIGNSYSLETSFQVNSGLTVGGWVGFTDANVLDLGRASVLNYALTVSLPNVGKEGNLLGFIVGQEPRLIGTNGFEIDGRRSDPDTSFHVEALYRYRVTPGISVTPGIIWITAPNHDRDNSDLVVVSVRTTFRF